MYSIKKKKNNIKISNKNVSFFIICGDSFTFRQIAFLKDKKIPSIGFHNFNGLSTLTDYTLLLESKYFASVFLINYVIKKLTYNVIN